MCKVCSSVSGNARRGLSLTTLCPTNTPSISITRPHLRCHSRGEQWYCRAAYPAQYEGTAPTATTRMATALESRYPRRCRRAHVLPAWRLASLEFLSQSPDRRVATAGYPVNNASPDFFKCCEL